MKNTHWYLQENIHKKDLEELINAILTNGMTYETFFHIPFDNQYPSLNLNDPLFVYSASLVTDQIYNDHNKFAGVFAHTDNISLEQIFSQNNQHMWSEAKFFGTLEQLSHLNLEIEEFFIRPVLDDKSFAGEIMTKSEFLTWYNKLDNTVIDKKTLKVMVAPLNYPKHEYRLCMIEGKYITGSLYKNHMRAEMSREVPLEIINFAEEFLTKVDLPEAVIIDVGLSENRIGIIEANGINNSGFYLMDKEKYVKAINNLLIKKYNTNYKHKIY